MRRMALTGIALGFGLTGLWTFGGAVAQQPSGGLPPPLEGRVDNRHAKFAYSSFFRIPDNGWTKIVNRICNEGTDELVVFWERAEIYRTLGSELAEHECHENPRAFPDYYIEYDAPIFYTQAKRQQPAEMYTIKTPIALEKITRESPLVSELKTYFTDGNGNRQVVDLAFHTFVENGSIVYQIHRSLPDSTISLGGFPYLVEADAQEAMAQQVSEFGSTLVTEQSAELIAEKQAEFLPDAFFKEEVMVLRPGAKPSDVIEFSIPADKITYGTGRMAVFDEQKRLLASGEYVFLVPQG